MKVRKNCIYRFDPVLWDLLDAPPLLRKGDLVRAVHLHGCPPPNTMGHCHVETLTGEFAGLVCTNSLVKLEKPKTPKPAPPQMPEWPIQTATRGFLQFDGVHYWLLSFDRKLVNRLDAFVTSFQLAVLREAGQPETAAR